MKKYKAFCLQNRTYFATGENKPKRECMEDIWEYLMTDNEEDINISGWSDDKLEDEINAFEVEIEEV